ncbi:MAG: anaerobic sulfatase maturase [Candidatus Latescibacterota bacterium]|nr:MAG: anaerobic sulfatase maturase [Candidatus Latescibacterota bacterium]
MIPFQLLIKPAGPDCNLQCVYCFYRRVSEFFPTGQVHRMSRDVLEEMIRQYLSLRFPVSCFSWQGGEPTLCGLNFFEEAVRLQMEHGRNGQVVSNAFQTNGILLNQEWCRFFNQYKFLVGLSLDGPRYLHDFYRKKDSRGSWEGVMRAARLLSEHEVEFNILAMVTRKSETKARELFHWFLDHNFRYLQFIPCLERLPQKGLAPFSATPEGYGDFLCELFDLWWENRNRQISIRLFDTVLERLVYGRPTLCIFSPVCQSYLVVEHDGSVYPCDFFVRKDTRLGNLMEKPLEEIFHSPAYKRFGERKSVLPDECRRCEWLSFCWGGCQKDRVDRQGRPAAKTLFCHSYRQFFSHAMPRLMSLVKGLQSSTGLQR